MVKAITRECLKALANQYEITISEVLFELEKAISKFFGEIEIISVLQNNNYKFFKLFYNRFNELKRDMIDLKPAEKQRIEKIFIKNLELKSTQNKLKKINYYKKQENETIIGEILEKTKNCYLISTKFGIATMSFMDLIIEEKRKGMYKNGFILRFFIKGVKMKNNRLKISLTRTSPKILEMDIKNIFTHSSDFYAINRVIGEKILIFTHNKKIPAREIIALSKLYKEQVKVEVAR